MNANHSITLLLVLLMAACSCQKEEIQPEQHETVELQFTCEKPSDTKTMWTGEDVIWTEGDKISVACLASGTWSSDMAESAPLDADCEKAQFTVPISLESSGSPMAFHAVYPSSCAVLPASGLPEVTVQIPQTQTPTATSFDRSADMMTAVSQNTYTSIPSTPVPLIWTRAVAHVEITLLDTPVLGGESLESIVLKADDGADLVGKHVINLSNGKVTKVEGNVTNMLVVDASNLDFDGEGNLRFNISVLPCTLESLTVILVTDASEYSKTITSQIPLKVDRRHTMSIDMSSAVRTDRTDVEKDPLVNSRIFDILDLEAAGMEQVSNAWQAGHPYLAAQALKTYWLGRTGIVNTEVNLSISKNTDSDKNIADQALKENGYRFYVKNYSEGTDANGNAIYYSFLGSDGGIDWEVTPVTETQFALQKHRHQWIEPQAKVYRVTGDEKYVQAIVEVYSDWLETYPCPGVGADSYAIASSHPYKDMWTDLQATSHVTTYLNVLDYCLQAEAFTPEFLTHFLVSLYDTVESIRANLYHTAASNHRLFEVQAIYNAAVLLPEFKAASGWETESYTALAEQRDLQFAVDGVQNEMDPGYHISVVSMFYQMYDLAKQNSREAALPENYVERLKNACLFVRDVMYPDYSMEDFNDTRSSGWTKSVLKKNFTKYAELFPDEPSFLYFSTEGQSGTVPAENFRAYRNSGWYMLRTGWTEDDMMLIYKNNYNEQGWWHCQPDNGTIGLYNKGRNFLPDAGTYTYGGSAADNALRDAFRATASHNTLTYNGETIPDGSMMGAFVSEEHTDEYDMVKAQNQSYPDLNHERTVYRMKDGGFFVVADAASGSAYGQEVAIHWHFCPGDTDSSKLSYSYSCCTTFDDGNNMCFRTFCFNGLEPSTGFTYSEGTSYTSNAIGKRTQRPYYTVGLTKTDTSTPVRFITVIIPVSSSLSLPEISAIYESESTIKVTVDGTTYTLN
ncbi:MAG: heparinase II/III family protein [Candidatus Cryptobacteroides sp.]